MAKRHACWVLVVGQAPTAFHAKRREDLLPTLKQLQRTQPGTLMKWFDRGRLWGSPEEAEDALKSQRQAPRAHGSAWRPGGKHVDPRAKYDIPRDEKRARFKRRLVQGRATGAPRPPRARKP